MAVEIEIDSAGIVELLQCTEIQGAVEEVAARVAATAGEDYQTSSFIGFDRAHAYVWAVGDEARKDCYENNTLLKALGQ